MRPRRPFVAAALVVLVAGSACSGGAGSSSDFERLGDVAYVLPAEPPTGWRVAWASERPGRPFSKWEHHTEVYATGDRKEFVVVGADKLVRESKNPTRPSAPRETDSDDFGYLFAYVVGANANLPRDSKAMVSSWRTPQLQMTVAHIAMKPQADLVRRVTKTFQNTTSFAFVAPAKLADRFVSVGSSAGLTEDATDYTVVYASAKNAGSSRERGSDLSDDAPTIALNVGSRFYAQSRSLPNGAKAARVETDKDRLTIEFEYRGSSVKLSGDGVTEKQLRAAAESLAEFDRMKWRTTLGERLLVQDVAD